MLPSIPPAAVEPTTLSLLPIVATPTKLTTLDMAKALTNQISPNYPPSTIMAAVLMIQVTPSTIETPTILVSPPNEKSSNSSSKAPVTPEAQTATTGEQATLLAEAAKSRKC